MDHEHGWWRIAIPRWPECWQLRSRVGRAVFDWALLHGNENDYERRIQALYWLGIQCPRKCV